MSKLPNISGNNCINALLKAGFIKKRQEDSHIVLRRDNPFSQIVVPNHKELDRGTLRAIIRQPGLTVEEFLKLLQILSCILHNPFIIELYSYFFHFAAKSRIPEIFVYQFFKCSLQGCEISKLCQFHKFFKRFNWIRLNHVATT